MFEQFVALSGLPRTGSTLLSAILSQNPEIHAEGNSAVCQLMWDMQQSILTSEQVKANRKSLTNDLVKAIPSIYYSHVKKPIIVDKCRSWTLANNMTILRQYFSNSPKVIVMTRPLTEIVASFAALRRDNGWTDLETGLLDDDGGPIMRSLAGVKWAKENDNGEFLFISYDELVDDTQASLSRIYEHCGWEPFTHNLENIVNYYLEDDLVYGLAGHHDVRPKISRRNIDIVLSNEIVEKCNILDEVIKKIQTRGAKGATPTASSMNVSWS